MVKHDKDIKWNVSNPQKALKLIKEKLRKANAIETFVDAIEETSYGLVYNSESYSDCVNSTYNSVSNPTDKVIGIYSDVEHFTSIGVADFSKKAKNIIDKLNDFYDENDLKSYHNDYLDDLDDKVSNKLEKLHQDLIDVIDEVIDEEFELTIDIVNEVVKSLEKGLNENTQMSFREYINESKSYKSSPKKSLNEAKISTKSDLLTDVYNEVFANNINDSQFIAYEEIADYLDVDYDDIIDGSIDVFAHSIQSRKGHWQLSYVVQQHMLQGIVDALDEKDIKADYDVSSPSYPSLVVNGDEIKTLKELKAVLKELDKDDD